MVDVKPATDAEMDAIRAGLPSTAFLFSPAHQVMMLIARIDAERAAREMAEARVKVLEVPLRKWALAEVYRPIYGCGTEFEGWRCQICLNDWHTRQLERHERTCPLHGTEPALKAREAGNG